MRFVDRNKVPAPEVLTRENMSGPKETANAIKHYEGPPVFKKGEPVGFKFAAYKHETVRTSLEDLFEKKCAYCENRYASFHPVDIEHWRPKAEVVTSDWSDADAAVTRGKGYYWLAANWHNLLPSCIDCNRVRYHKDLADGKEKTLGKGNWFPLADEKVRTRSPAEDPKEDPLLLNPCQDNPDDFFEYREVGLIVPRGDIGEPMRLRAKASIRFYALNRSELVQERRARYLQITQKILTLDSLVEAANRSVRNKDVHAILDDLILRETEQLEMFADPDQTFSSMARHLIKAYYKKLGKEQTIPG